MSKSELRKQVIRHEIMAAIKACGKEVTGDMFFALAFRSEAELKKIRTGIRA